MMLQLWIPANHGDARIYCERLFPSCKVEGQNTLKARKDVHVPATAQTI